MNISEEILNTFSNRKSFFASKRIERFLVFMLVYTSMAWYLYKNIYYSLLTAGDLCLVTGALMSYAAYNTYQIRKDKQQDGPQKEDIE